MGHGKSREIEDRAQMIELLRKAVGLGMDFVDTAEIHGPWTNEIMLGGAFASMPAKVTIATKFGFDVDEKQGWRAVASIRGRRISAALRMREPEAADKRRYKMRQVTRSRKPGAPCPHGTEGG